MSKSARRVWLLLSLVTGIALGAWLFPARSHRITTPAKNLTPPLERLTGHVDFNRVPLQEAIDQLAVRTRTTISVDWHAVQIAGVDYWTPIRIGFDDQPLGKAIELLLASTSDPHSSAALAVWARAGVIYVGERNGPGSGATCEAYDVRDIVEEISAGMIPVDEALIPPGTERGDPIDAVFKIIMNNVDPDSWRDTGGSVGRVREFETILIIDQTPSGHAKVRSLLTHLREAQSARRRGEPPPFHGIDLLAELKPQI